MDSSKRRITVKVFIGYLLLGLLVATVGYLVFTQVDKFTKTQRSDTAEKNKILKVGKILTLMYETESSARAAVQANSTKTFNFYFSKNDTLNYQIDSLKYLLDNAQQVALLDSVKALLNKKVNNIVELKNLKKSSSLSNEEIEGAIRKLTSLESKLGKVSFEDFVGDPEKLSPQIRKNYQELFQIANRYSERNGQINQKTLDSIITVSKLTLNEIRSKSSAQQESIAIKENELLQNDLMLSQQLRTILSAFEQDLLSNSSQLTNEREQVLKDSINIVTTAAIVGVVLAIIFSIMILNDFWKSQRYRRRLEQANETAGNLLKNREQLISTVSHDLRTPLSTIVGYTELLKNASLSHKESYYVNSIKSASSYVTQLVNDLLDFTKLEAGKIHIESVPFSLENIIVETSNSVQSIFTLKPIDLIIDIDERLHRELIGDPFRIRQILTNLVGNAYKFTEKGQIKITAKLLEKFSDTYRICISVEDTGIGIKRDKQELIFKEFTQAESDTEKKYGGSGLGLTISQKLTTLLNGTLELKSEENKGSIFIIKIPLKVSENHIQNIETTPQKQALHLDLTAVVIDDDPALLELTSEVLRQQHITVHNFMNASRALENIENITYDLVITDIQMPKMNGFRFAELLKSSVHYQNQPIIAMTGRKDMSKELYLDGGFNEVIYKPYSPDVLIKTIHTIFQEHTTTITTPPEEIEVVAPMTTNENSLYDLTSLRAFLANDEDGVEQIIETLHQTTTIDIEVLHNYVTEKDLEGIRDVAHKMLPMYRQIHAKKVVPILQHFEHITSVDNLEEKLSLLKIETSALFEALGSPIYFSPEK
ncbi:hybrid sensor histidine kinase/response regulator [Zhouia sp. PK063]|uniref:hybrid sensor histidine kinase/response regulator n=1 Tax=Zhouia sp. PK063 TaxID=3373602 RepID=UPI003796DD93